MLKPEHCRAVRAWFGWTQEEFAKMAGVSLSTVRDFERGPENKGRTPIANNLRAMAQVIEGHGVRLLEDNGRPAGIAIVAPAGFDVRSSEPGKTHDDGDRASRG